jgi:hypothetical protein
MKHLKLFENFEVVEPIKYGESLNQKEINFLKEYNIPCPEWILKDDNYYYVFDHRCEKIKDLPLTYIHGVCSLLEITNYKINDDFTVDVGGDRGVFIDGRYMDSPAYRLKLIPSNKLPLKFNKVRGTFNCSYNKLTTLEGAPKQVGGNFFCENNKLTTLEGAPEYVGRDFRCVSNKLTTLEHGPDYVGGDFICYDNPLESTEYKGTIKGYFIPKSYGKKIKGINI